MKVGWLMWIVAITACAVATSAVPLAGQDQQAGKGINTRHHHYKLVDLGTFGGPNSFLSGLTGPLNFRGVVTGCADSAIVDPNFSTQNPYFGGDPYIQIAYRWANDKRFKLRTLPGGTNACTQWINDSGQIVGASDIGVNDPFTGLQQIRAVLWDRDGRVHNLGTLGGNGSVAWAINSAGQVTGNALNDIPDDFSSNFGIVGATQTHAFLWQDGVMRDLGTLGGTDSGPYAINERGQVVGLSAVNSTVNETTGLPSIDPFFWDGRSMIDLGSLGGTYGLAVALNNRGQVIGNSSLAGDQTSHGFLWPSPDGKMIDLRTLGGSYTEPHAINDVGAVTGASFISGDTAFHAVLWTEGKVLDLGVVSGDLCAEGQAINSTGQIVGYSNHDSCLSEHAHGFLWENGELVDLNQLVTNSTSLTVVEGVFISDRGEIAGDALTPEGNHRGVLLIPCDGGHPNVQGCDYTDVDQNVSSQAADTTMFGSAETKTKESRRSFISRSVPGRTH